MSDDLVTALLPVLGGKLERGFNVFDVMHHGTHEKQMSNVFRWLLEAQGTHGLGDLFAALFIDEVNRALPSREPFPRDGYWVQQEVNTVLDAQPADIADIVLESASAVIVVENYFMSDGHGHSFDHYESYALRDGREGAVVLLCQEVDAHAQTHGWEKAAVVTYASLITQLLVLLKDNRAYQRDHPEAYSFLLQMEQRFVKGVGLMDDRGLIDFMATMCLTGDAARYRERHQDAAAEQFAADLAERARDRFEEGRDLLRRLKLRLRNYISQSLRPQLSSTLGSHAVRHVNSRFSGIYQWSIVLDLADAHASVSQVYLAFGPTAWFVLEDSPQWADVPRPAKPDYERLQLLLATSAERTPLEVRESAVSLGEILGGLDTADSRLHDEIVDLLARAPGQGGGMLAQS